MTAGEHQLRFPVLAGYPEHLVEGLGVVAVGSCNLRLRGLI